MEEDNNGGLLGFLKTPEGMGLLGTVFGGLAGAKRGQPINSLGRAGLAGSLAYGYGLNRDEKAKQAALAAGQETANMNAIRSAFRQGADNIGQLPREVNIGSVLEQNPNMDAAGLKQLLELNTSRNPIEARTSEQKNWEFGNTLPPEQRALFMAGNKTNTEPSSIQEWNAYNAMTPDQQKAFLNMKRTTQMVDMGGFVAPNHGGSLGSPIPKTLAPGDLPSTRGAQASATAQATTGVKTAEESTKAIKKSDQLLEISKQAESLLNKRPTGSSVGAAVDYMGRTVGVTSESAKTAAELETVAGWMVSNVPRMEGPQSNFDVANYQTMAAKVGDRSVPVAERKAALNALRSLQEKYKHLNQGGADTPAINPTPAQPAPSGAINMLKMNPKWRAEFDKKYGAGSAAKVLGR
jgi:hypothetical protein